MSLSNFHWKLVRHVIFVTNWLVQDELTESKPLGTYLLNISQDATKQRAFFDRLKVLTLSLRIQKIDTSPIGITNVVDCSHLAIDVCTNYF